jgi:hypothetical protein
LFQRKLLIDKYIYMYHRSYYRQWGKKIICIICTKQCKYLYILYIYILYILCTCGQIDKSSTCRGIARTLTHMIFRCFLVEPQFLKAKIHSFHLENIPEP